MRYRFIQQHQKELPVKKMCQVLKVSRSGYYDWTRRSPSHRQQRREHLLEKIRQVHQASRQLYGSPRVHAEMKSQGEKVCENTVAKVMKHAGIRSKLRRRFVPRTTDSGHHHAVAANVLDRCFEQKQLNRTWCTDITCISTSQGWLYLAVVMDLCSRRIIGWSMAEHVKAELCINALSMALQQRRPGKGLMHHSDRGVQYACEDYQALLERCGIVCSMSRTGNCYDNAAMESFFSSFKRELVYQRQMPYATHEQARSEIFEYIECWYNRRRLHSSLGYVSPIKFEASFS